MSNKYVIAVNGSFSEEGPFTLQEAIATVKFDLDDSDDGGDATIYELVPVKSFKVSRDVVEIPLKKTRN